MKIQSFFWGLTFMIVCGCESIHIPANAPDCLVKLVRTSSPEAIEINSYQYEGKTVYLVDFACCDAYQSLYDETCHFICAPGGGITGKGDGKCPGIMDQLSDKKLIWKAK